MVCSTAAHSIMRLTHSCSVPASLSVSCLSVLKSSHRAYLSTMIPGLRYLTQSIFADILKTRPYDENKDKLEFLANYVEDDFELALMGRGIKRKKMCSLRVLNIGSLISFYKWRAVSADD